MKKDDPLTDDLRPEYRLEDFGKMEKGESADRMLESSNVIVLAPDVAEVFPNGDAVKNYALCDSLSKVARSSVRPSSP